jgi:nicotinamidase-related amidase
VADDRQLTLNLRAQRLRRDSASRAFWERITSPKTVPASRTAVLICDVWDNHWSRGAAERCAKIAARVNEVVTAARGQGVSIIHAPSDVIDFYADHPARERMLAIPAVSPPESADHADPPLPIDDSDGGSDTGEKPWHKAWSRQHSAIVIDDQDVISDRGHEIYSFLRHRGIVQVVIMGVHTNMCVLHRSFGIKQMVRWGVNIALARDLTDTMYNPEMAPYVNHDEGTRLVIEFIEKFWCPTLTSEELTRAR